MGGDSPAAEGTRQARLQIVAGVQNKSGDILQAWIAALAGEDRAAA